MFAAAAVFTTIYLICLAITILLFRLGSDMTQEPGERGEGSVMFSAPSPVRRKAKQKRQTEPAAQAYSIRNSEEFLISDAFDIAFGEAMSLLVLSAVSAKFF